MKNPYNIFGLYCEYVFKRLVKHSESIFRDFSVYLKSSRWI